MIDWSVPRKVLRVCTAISCVVLFIIAILMQTVTGPLEWIGYITCLIILFGVVYTF